MWYPSNNLEDCQGQLQGLFPELQLLSKCSVLQQHSLGYFSLILHFYHLLGFVDNTFWSYSLSAKYLTNQKTSLISAGLKISLLMLVLVSWGLTSWICLSDPFWRCTGGCISPISVGSFPDSGLNIFLSFNYQRQQPAAPCWRTFSTGSQIEAYSGLVSPFTGQSGNSLHDR